jgi:hypothetical protein
MHIRSCGNDTVIYSPSCQAIVDSVCGAVIAHVEHFALVHRFVSGFLVLILLACHVRSRLCGADECFEGFVIFGTDDAWGSSSTNCLDRMCARLAASKTRLFGYRGFVHRLMNCWGEGDIHVWSSTERLRSAWPMEAGTMVVVLDRKD